MFLLDTNVVSELRKGGRGDPGLVTWASSVPVRHMSISVVTVHEIELGVRLVERRDLAQGSVLRDWFDGEVLPAFAGRIIDVDAQIARTAATLHVPDPMPVMDSIIAATAIVHGLTVVTRNVRDIGRGGLVDCLDPFTRDT